MYVTYNKEIYPQKQGVGWCVAPILADLLFGAQDKILLDSLLDRPSI